MSSHKCNTCFYKNMDRDSWPCMGCNNYSRYVNYMAFNEHPHGSQWKELDKVIVSWKDSVNGITGEDLSKATEHDAVNHPKHYTEHPSGVECIQVTEHMGFNLGNAVKYIWRCDLKRDAIEDLKKAKWYIEREISKREQSNLHGT
jgi:hypothetical protein